MKPLRTMTIELAKVSKKQRDEYPYKMTIPAYIQDVKACLNGLSDAGKRLFKRVLSSQRPYPRWLTRHEIARLIGHAKMLPHDIRLVNEMVALGLLEQSKRARRKLSNGMPNGFEYVYTIPNNVLWACQELGRLQANATPKPTTDSATPQTDTPIPAVRQRLDIDKLLDESRHKQRRGLFGRLRGK